MKDEKTLTAPYGAWETFSNALQQFAEGIPPRIDRSAFPGLAWNSTTRLLNGLKFFGLIDDEGTPDPVRIEAITLADEVARKYAFGKILRERYASVFKLDLARVTPSHLAETLGDAYNTKGDTREKAVRFFIAAATWAGIPLSPLLTRDKARRPAMIAKVRRADTTPRPTRERVVRQPKTTTVGDGATRTVQLASGGVLTLTASVDFLTLSAEDRAFLFNLIDSLATYEHDHPADEHDDD